jgi:pantoate--beta-alanine ligase
MTQPQIIEQAPALRGVCDGMRAQHARVGFVPTMGALHAGHMSLVAAARARGCQRVVLSVFVNPLQFGPSEDFAKYPRTWDTDLALCADHGVDVVYAPDPHAMYAPGFQTHVEVEQVTQGFEGAARPTHFRGVTTVVTKLFNAVGPCTALFGRKDYQQWRAIERMVRDLDMPIEVVGCPILREPDGLAMSSRNRYLEPAERVRATAIHTGLKRADAAYRGGERAAAVLEAAARTAIAESFDSIDYVTLADAESLQPISGRAVRPPVLIVAARLGKTRLLDNAVLGEDSL